MIECSISGEGLRAFRTRGLKTSLRAFGTALPILVVAAVFWREEFIVVMVISGITSLAAGFSAWRWLKEIMLPENEQFTLHNDTLTRRVGGVDKARVHYSSAKGVMRNRHAMVVHGETSIIIPMKSEGFASITEALSTWRDVKTPKSIAGDAAAHSGIQGFLLVTLLSGFLIYLSYETGVWRWFLSTALLGLVIADLLWRLMATRAKSARPSTF